ncbi:glycosyl hydrolase family 18 protein [Bacillus suaedaesalsae]|uniref:S-layer homology domain-containing protein n=1 Tax=Bacillus suaedaesalsae TaxID=2810349 RepID=A0ABS2DKQ0_9BACI|nr:glycosyl hydrolase family 18 protein [Bacillus suaedaesalsae]MBM6619069.1 S-layer homology domain-containing protein [Bacillus suaedaesalsae]
MEEIFLTHRLIRKDNGHILVVYINNNSTEVSTEFGLKTKEGIENLREYVSDYIYKHLPNKKIIGVNIMLGSLLFASLPYHKAKAHEVDFNMTYLYYGSTNTFISNVEKAKGNLNTVSPSYFDLNSNGSLQLTYQVDSKFINDMHAKGIKVVPFISNHWDRELGRTALNNREQLAQQIADAIIIHNLDGVNVDIENVTDVDRQQYTDFVRLLRSKIPKDRTISVAVSANPNGWTKGWHGSYDYKMLANYSDYLVIMAYDESYSGGPEGPVASLPWVEKSVQYALNQGVPDNKIVLGIPFFGRYWIEGKSYGGYGISQVQVKKMLDTYGGKVIFDEKYKSPKATITIDSTDSTMVVGGRTLGPGTYHVWYENNDSIQAKVDLIHKYNLKGTGSWSLGQEDTAVWNEYGIWLSGHYGEMQGPNDIVGHWAEEDIKVIYEKGWMKGKTLTGFFPDDPLTRAEAAVILVRALSLEPKSTIGNSFSDVSTTYWAKKEIEIASQHGLFVGEELGKFKPGEELTREQMAVVLRRALNLNEEKVAISPFKDIVNTRWSYNDIATMNKNGIFSGFNDGTFRPIEGITRAQMAALLNRITGYLPSQ